MTEPSNDTGASPSATLAAGTTVPLTTSRLPTIEGAQFSLDDFSDMDDSRPSSPAFAQGPLSRALSDEKAEGAEPVPVGRSPDEVYERVMSAWRYVLRRAVARNVQWESEVLAAMQVCLCLRVLLGTTTHHQYPPLIPRLA